MVEMLYLGTRRLSRKGDGYVLSIPKVWQKYGAFNRNVRLFIVGQKLILEPEMSKK